MEINISRQAVEFLQNKSDEKFKDIIYKIIAELYEIGDVKWGIAIIRGNGKAEVNCSRNGFFNKSMEIRARQSMYFLIEMMRKEHITQFDGRMFLIDMEREMVIEIPISDFNMEGKTDEEMDELFDPSLL